MRGTVTLPILLALCLSGCGAITRDFRHPGGYPGRLLDKRTFDASESKQLQLLRFTIVLAMAARMADETSTDAEDAGAIAEYLAASADEINYAAANIYPSGGTPPCRVGGVPPPATPSQVARLNSAVAEAEQAARQARQSAQVATNAEGSVRAMLANGTPPVIAAPAVAPANLCKGYYVNFEADVPLIEARMMRLLLAALPRDQIRKFAEDIQQGNFLGSAWNGLKLAFVSIKGLHTASGTYRAGQETLVANFSQCSGLSSDVPVFSEYDESVWTVKQAVACLGLSPDSLFGPHPGEIEAKHMPKTVTEESFAAVMHIARTSCARLPIGTADNSSTELTEARERRAALCSKLRWNPKPRLDMIETG